MDKYKEFLNEDKEEQAEHVTRLERLVKMAIPLLDKFNPLFMDYKKYKRANECSRRLNIVWDKIFYKKKEKPKSEFDLKVFEQYVYVPDENVYREYARYKGRLVTLLKIKKDTVKSNVFCDSINPRGCDYYIEFPGLIMSRKIWTKRHCLHAK